jgi:hypothetical protein
MDFTLKTYRLFLNALINQGFSFCTFKGFLENPGVKYVILRHDVDRKPENSLVFARIQYDLGITGTYYFRILPSGWNEKIIREIASLGHEIGYHYEDVSLAAARQKLKVKRQKSGNLIKSDLQDCKTARMQDNGYIEKELAGIAIESFKKNLQSLRGFGPVNTICMHGSPLSRWDSRILWKYYDYHDLGIIGEPYFDVDFNKVLYLTDTGRRWDGEIVSVRDRVQGTGHRAQGCDKFTNWKVQPVHYRDIASQLTISPPPPAPRPLLFHSTSDIINTAEEGRLADKIMMTFHPQRWTDDLIPWMRELLWQNVKNAGKYLIVKMKSNR